MNQDPISEICIDSQGRLCVTPKSRSFPDIYREAMEISWDGKGHFLYSPPPREWPYARWFLQIVEAARKQGVELQITEQTRWHGIPAESQREMLVSPN